MEKLPENHQITIFVKKGKRGIKNSDQVVKSLQKKYGKEMKIVSVEPDKLGMKDQILLLLDTTILISPCGSISISAIFLPPGASLIVTDFAGYQDRDLFTSDHMEASLWNALSWLNDLYYSIDSPEEFGYYGEMHSPSTHACNLMTTSSVFYRYFREQCDIKIKRKKLFKLVDHAMYIMSNWQLKIDPFSIYKKKEAKINKNDNANRETIFSDSAVCRLLAIDYKQTFLKGEKWTSKKSECGIHSLPETQN